MITSIHLTITFFWNERIILLANLPLKMVRCVIVVMTEKGTKAVMMVWTMKLLPLI